MTREEFGILAKAMKAVYSQPTFLPDKDAFNVWYNLLQDMPYNLANIALQKHMMSSVFPPTIADIRKNSVTETEDEEMEGLEAWSVVKRAIRNSSYYAEEEFNRLPDNIQKAIGSPANLREMSAMEEKDVNTIEQSHFIRSYRAVRERKKHEAQLPTGFKAALERASTKGIASSDSRMIEGTHGELY